MLVIVGFKLVEFSCLGVLRKQNINFRGVNSGAMIVIELIQVSITRSGNSNPPNFTWSFLFLVQLKSQSPNLLTGTATYITSTVTY